MIHKGLLCPEEAAAWKDRQRSGTDGLAACRSILRHRSSGPSTESDLETECLQVLRAAALPAPARQWWISDRRERIGRIDLAYPHARLGIEVDGFEWHGDYISFHRDRERYNAAVAAGWRLLLFTKKTDRDRFVEQVRQILSEAQGTLFG